jgi:hypothetical protein
MFHVGRNEKFAGRLMRFVTAVTIFVFQLIAYSGQGVSPSPQAKDLLRKVLTVLSPTSSVRDATLSGSVHYIAGSDDEYGTAVLKATPDASRMDLNLPSGRRTEIRNLAINPPSGQWLRSDGKLSSIPYHNLLNEPAWFSPVSAVSHLLASPVSSVADLGLESFDTQSLRHISITQVPSDSSNPIALLSHLTQFDLYVDPSTFLPMTICFNEHPDEDAAVDIQIKIYFSDYRVVNGIQIPFRIQKFLNNGLSLDLQFNNVVVNSGLAITEFDMQQVVQ